MATRTPPSRDVSVLEPIDMEEWTLGAAAQAIAAFCASPAATLPDRRRLVRHACLFVYATVSALDTSTQADLASSPAKQAGAGDDTHAVSPPPPKRRATEDEDAVSSTGNGENSEDRDRSQCCPICQGPGRKYSSGSICAVCYSGVYNDLRKVFNAVTTSQKKFEAGVHESGNLALFVQEFKALSRSCKNNFSCEPAAYHFECKGKRCTACRTLACVKIVPHLVNDMLLKGLSALSSKASKTLESLLTTNQQGQGSPSSPRSQYHKPSSPICLPENIIPPKQNVVQRAPEYTVSQPVINVIPPDNRANAMYSMQPTHAYYTQPVMHSPSMSYPMPDHQYNTYQPQYFYATNPPGSMPAPVSGLAPLQASLVPIPSAMHRAPVSSLNGGGAILHPQPLMHPHPQAIARPQPMQPQPQIQPHPSSAAPS